MQSTAGYIKLKLYQKHVKSKQIVLIVGDLNAHHKLWHSKRNNHSGLHLVNFINEHKLHNLNYKTPTHFATTGAFTIIDFALVSHSLLDRTQTTVLEDTLSSDHFPLVTQLNTNFTDYLYTSDRFNTRKANWNLFNETVDLSKTYSPDINTFNSNIINQITEAANLAIPRLKSHNKHKKKLIPY